MVTAPLKRRPPTGKSAVFLDNGIQIAQEIGAGLQAGSEALGWHYKTISINQNNPATVPSGMLSAIQGGANVVYVSATPAPIFKSALAVAKAKGVAVIDISSGNPPTPGITSLVNNGSTSGILYGKLLALGALADAEKAGQTAHMVIVTSPIFATIVGPIGATTQKTVSQLCPKCTVDTLSIPPNDLFGGKSPADIVSYLQSHPNVKYVLQTASLTDQGLVPALKGAGISGVNIYGVAPLPPQVQELKAGTEQGWVDVPLQVEGWMSADAAARSMTSDNPAIYNSQSIPSYLLTKANASGPVEVPTDYESQFKQIWKLH